MPQLGPITLAGQSIHLLPLSPDHQPALLQAAQPQDIWPYMPNNLSIPAEMSAWIASAAQEQQAGVRYTFVVARAGTGQVVGSSSYLDVSQPNRSVEIGWTWYNPAVWATMVNPEAKYLLLRHAFEAWGAIRVFLKTDARNLRSQAAIRKLGGVYEGTLRKHRILPNGFQRDSAYFSIIDTEWPSVKARLEQRLLAFEPASN